MGLFSFLKTSKDQLPILRLHNTLSKTTEDFKPLSKGKVLMYNCGPTVYGTQHIGNMRAAVFADTLRRTLETWDYAVRQVINITDFGHLSSDSDEGEDKMTTGLRREGLALTLPNMRTLAEKYAQEYFVDIELLGLPVKKIQFPRASDYVPDQVALIHTLEQKGYAYKIEGGVYFDTSRFSDYGKLGGINAVEQLEGARLQKNEHKRSAADFVLWKSDSKLGWPSPWGLGFPGWHIECTAMIFKLLGKQIDIHTGGIEHIPIHHNNEIAQAEAASGKQFVNYWLHNDHITIEGKKISKSLGNTIYLHNIVDRGLSARALRYWFLTAHYRSPANFTWDALEGCDAALQKLTRAYLELPSGKAEADPSFTHDFYTAIASDLDTPQALARVWELVKDTSVSPGAKRAALVEADRVLGLGFSENRPMAKLTVKTEDLPEDIQKLLAARAKAREEKDFAAADTLRDEIETLGYTVADSAEGQKVIKN